MMKVELSDLAAEHGVEPVTAEGPILLAFDDSPHALAAVHAAARLFGSRRKAVVLVVVEAPSRVSQPKLDDAHSKARAVLAHGVSEARQAGFSDVDGVVALEQDHAGADRREIARRITAEGAARGAVVIVVGSRGRTGLAGAVLGSVSNGLLSRCTVPLLLVSPEAKPDQCDGPALLCYDGTDGTALGVAASLLTKRSRRNAVVSYVWPVPAGAVGLGLTPRQLFLSTRIAEQAAQARASRLLVEGKRLAQAAGFTGVQTRSVPEAFDLAHGLPHADHLGVVEAVAEVADAYRARVIVVTPHREGVTGALRRVSVSWGLSHHDSFLGQLVQTRHPLLVIPRHAGGARGH